MRCEVHTSSEDETRALGRRVGRALAVGDLIGLCGPLGAGKTCLVRGIAEGLEVPPARVRSPSFTLVVSYTEGRVPLYHVDLFRMTPSPLDRLALREYMYGDGACVIEWFDHWGEAVEHLRIDLAYAGFHDRRILMNGSGDRYGRLLEAVMG